MKQGIYILLVILMMLSLLCGCQTSKGRPTDNPADLPPQTDIAVPGEVDPPPGQDEGPDPQMLAYRPNEAGQVMILMYHEIGGEEGTWRRSTENFRQDLETLYNEDYRPVALLDYVTGKITIPAGKTPFVITFDDSTAGQFRFIEEDGGEFLDPDCAVAILLAMGEKYADFIPEATFFINYPVPFRQNKHIGKKLELLGLWGFEIGNHTYNHENLARISREDAVQALAKHVKSTQNYLPFYQVRSLALPYGARPQDDSYLIKGTMGDVSYHHEAILMVGANPAPSPFSLDFNTYRLPRVRADGQELNRWLEFFRQNPDKRFRSDGNPDRITVPEDLALRLASTLVLPVFLYNPDEINAN